MDMVCWHLITHGWNWISSINIHFVFTSKCAFINVLLLGLQFGKYHCKHCMGTTILSYFWTQEFHEIIQHRYDWLVVGFLNFPSDKTGCFWILLLIVSDLHLDDLITNSIDPIFFSTSVTSFWLCMLFLEIICKWSCLHMICTCIFCYLRTLFFF